MVGARVHSACCTIERGGHAGHLRTPATTGESDSTQGRRQPSTLVGVQGEGSLFESPNGRLDADPARTQELVQLNSKDPEASSCVVLGEFAGPQPSADRLGRYKRDPGGVCNRVEGRQF